MQLYKRLVTVKVSVTVRHRLYLCAVWLIGFSAGFYLANGHSEDTFTLMRSVIYDRPSIVSLLSVTYLPFLITILLLKTSKLYLLYPFVFAKAFSFSYALISVSVAFGSAGWLLRWLLLFSNSCTIVILLWFWLKIPGQKQSVDKMQLFICVLLVALVVCFDQYVIWPFSVALFD